jgi:general secretion pathway protein I
MLARRRSCAGFGLLEAIVALALLAGTGLALFDWIQQNLQSASRLRERERQLRLQLSAQQLIETVNPMKERNGSTAVGPYTVRWEAVPLQDERRNAAPHRAEVGAWRVGLYALKVHAVDRSDGTETRFEQWRVGTERLQAATESLQ